MSLIAVVLGSAFFWGDRASAKVGDPRSDALIARLARLNIAQNSNVWQTDALSPLGGVVARLTSGRDVGAANAALVYASTVYLAPGVCTDSPDCDPGARPTYERGVMFDAGIFIEWGRTNVLSADAKAAVRARLMAVQARGLCYGANKCIDPDTRGAYDYMRSENHTLVYVIGKYLTLVALNGNAGDIASLERYLERFLVEHGKYGWSELRSGIYDPINFGPIFALIKWAPSERLRTLAAMTIDTYIVEGLVTGPPGLPGGSALRHYPGVLFEIGPISSYFATASQLYFGTDFVNIGVDSYTYLMAASDYELPPAVADLGDRQALGSYDYDISFDLPFGDPSHGRRSGWVTLDVALGAMQQFQIYLPKITGANVWGDQYLGDVIFPSKPEARVLFIGGNRTRKQQDYRGERGFRFGDVMLLKTGRPDAREPGGIACAQAADQIVERHPWLLVRGGDGYAAWRPATGDYTRMPGHYASTDFFQTSAADTPGVVIVSSRALDGSLDGFFAALSAHNVTWTQQQLCASARGGERVCFDYAMDQPSVNGRPFVPGRDRVKSRWVNAPGADGVWTISPPSNKTLVLDFTHAQRTNGVRPTPGSDAGHEGGEAGAEGEAGAQDAVQEGRDDAGIEIPSASDARAVDAVSTAQAMGSSSGGCGCSGARTNDRAPRTVLFALFAVMVLAPAARRQFARMRGHRYPPCRLR